MLPAMLAGAWLLEEGVERISKPGLVTGESFAHEWQRIKWGPVLGRYSASVSSGRSWLERKTSTTVNKMVKLGLAGRQESQQSVGGDA